MTNDPKLTKYRERTDDERRTMIQWRRIGPPTAEMIDKLRKALGYQPERSPDDGER